MSKVVVEPLALEALPESVDGVVDATSVAPDLSLVEHVQVRLAARLGHAEISIGELFALKAGKVVVLDQQLDDSITLELNGKPVATAELVAIGEHFGVRIIEVL